MRSLVCALLGVAAVHVGVSQALAAIQWKVEDGGNGHWYEAVYEPTRIYWSEARQAAHARGGYLASITSAAENLFVFNLAYDDKFWTVDRYWSALIGPWLGGYQYDKLDEPAGHWAWDSGEPWGYTNWWADRPDDYYGAEDWLNITGENMVKSAKWNDMPAAGPLSWCFPNSYVIEWSESPTIPEPSTLIIWSLLGAGGICAGWYRRKKGT